MKETTVAEVEARLMNDHLRNIDPADEVARARAIRRARLQAPEFAAVENMFREKREEAIREEAEQKKQKQERLSQEH